MSQVTLTIGGKSHTVACADGDEEQIVRLGAMIEAKLAQLGGNLSASPTQNLLFAALLLADELQEMRAGRPGSDPQSAPTPPPAPANAIDPALLERLAERLELFATTLEQKLAAS